MLMPFVSTFSWKNGGLGEREPFMHSFQIRHYSFILLVSVAFLGCRFSMPVTYMYSAYIVYQLYDFIMDILHYFTVYCFVMVLDGFSPAVTSPYSIRYLCFSLRLPVRQSRTCGAPPRFPRTAWRASRRQGQVMVPAGQDLGGPLGPDVSF